MRIRRAGRTAASANAPRRHPLPVATPMPRGAGPASRRRAALGHLTHAPGDVSGFDGDVSVRYEAVHRRADPACGERRLLLAVLEDGIRACIKYARATHGRGLTLRREAYLWLTARQPSDVFAFEPICEALGIDPSRLRRRVLTEASDAVAAPPAA